MKSHFKPLKSQSNLWLGALFASWLFTSALLFFEGISSSRRLTLFYCLKFSLLRWDLGVHSRTMLFSTTLLSVTPLHSDSFLSWCRFYQTDQRQKYVWMKHQNKAFKCLFGCTEASSASVNSFSKRIWGNNKNRLLLHTRLFAEISISMWLWWLLCDWCYLSLSSCSVAGSTSTVQPPGPEAQSCPKYTPVFFCLFFEGWGGAIKHLAIGALFKIITFFLGKWLLCPWNPCKMGMKKGWHLCSSQTWIINTGSFAGLSRDGGGKCLLT